VTDEGEAEGLLRRAKKAAGAGYPRPDGS